MTARRLAFLALFTAIALIIHTVESLIPMPVPVPGVKPGLANTVTLFMLFTPISVLTDEKKIASHKKRTMGTGDVIAVLLCRIVLGALIAGRPVVIAYSLAGGLFAVMAQIVMKRLVGKDQIWVCGAMGAIFHNIGQILVAVTITGTPAVASYLPVLIIAGVVTGTFTGLIAQLAVHRLSSRRGAKH